MQTTDLRLKCVLKMSGHFTKTFGHDFARTVILNTVMHMHPQQFSKAHSEPSQTTKMELLAKTVNRLQPLTVFPKSFVVDVCLSPEYACF